MLWACVCVACLNGPTQAQDPSGVIYLEIPPCDYYVQPCEKVEVAVKVKDLTHRINLITAMVNYPAVDCLEGEQPVKVFCASDVKAGKPFWTDLRISSRDQTSTDFIMTLLPPEFKAIGTIADNTVATITLTACEQEGRAHIYVTDAVAKIVNGCAGQCPCPLSLDLTPADPIQVIVDGTPPTVRIVSIRHEDDEKCGELMQNCCSCAVDGGTTGNPCSPTEPPANSCCAPGTCFDMKCAGPGKVWIVVESIDTCSGSKVPSVQVVTTCGDVQDITHTAKRIDATNQWKYLFEITDDTEPGLAVVMASATDRAGNVSDIVQASFRICPVLTVSGLVELEGFAGTVREVYFTVRAKIGQDEQTFRYIRAMEFNRMEGYCHAVGTYLLKIPGVKVCDVTSICVKTAWNLSRVHIVKPEDYCCGHLVVDFTGLKWLVAGDVSTCQDPCPLQLPPPLGNDKIDEDDIFVVDNAIGDAPNYYNYWADVNGDGVVTESDMDLVLKNEILNPEGEGKGCCVD